MLLSYGGYIRFMISFTGTLSVVKVKRSFTIIFIPKPNQHRDIFFKVCTFAGELATSLVSLLAEAESRRQLLPTYPPILRNRTTYIQTEMTRLRAKCTYYMRVYTDLYDPPCLYFEAFNWYVHYYGDVPEVSVFSFHLHNACKQG